MKKKLLVGLLLCAVFACTKQNDADQPVKNQKKSALTISVADFIKKTKPLSATSGRQSSSSTARDSSLTGITDIYYFVFTGTHTIVSYKHQTSLESNFGTISDSLLPGNYWVTVTATAAPLVVRTDRAELEIPSVNYSIANAYPDAFYSGQSITVTQQPLSVSMSTLLRIMSGLEVNIVDMTASDSANVSIMNEYGVINLHDGHATDDPILYGTLPIANRSLGTYSDFVGNYNAMVYINYKDRITQSWKTKSIWVDNLQPNTQTILSGKLFSPVTVPDRVGAGFEISVNKNWYGTPYVIHF